jgi:drug/metabolite transporter (DMT)-like permease
MSSSILPWAWVPIVIWAALAQTARNAAQRSLVAHAGTWGATLARFLFGLPFAALWVGILHSLPATASALPRFHAAYFGWLLLGALGQLVATAAMLAAMKQRNFVVGVAYSKTDALQVAIFASFFLGEVPGWITLIAIGTATAGVVLLSIPTGGERAARMLEGGMRVWVSRAGWLGLASGAGFAVSALGYRGAALELPDVSPWLIGAWGVLWAQAAQTLLLGGWLAWDSPSSLRAMAGEWRVSVVAGLAGALASIGWFTAFALTSAANVRTLGMIEVVFSYLVSRRFMKEQLAKAEQLGLGLVLLGLLVLCVRL